MKKGNKIIALILVMAFTILSVNPMMVEAKTKELTAKQILRKSASTASKINTSTMTVEMQMVMDVIGKKYSEKVSMQLLYNKKPLKAKQVSTSIKDGKKVKTTEYYERKGNKVYVYKKQGSSYVKTKSDSMNVKALSSLNPAKMLKGSLTEIKNSKIKSKNGKVAGRSAYVITTEMSADKIIKDTTYDNSENTEGMGELKDNKITVTFWIDKKTFYPLKYTYDLKDVYNVMFEEAYGSDAIKMKKAKVVITYTKINKTGKIKLPSVAN